MDRELLMAWRTWRKMTAPVENFRNGRGSAPSYEYELSLDHLASSLVELFQNWREPGTARRKRALQAATELDSLIERVSDSTIEASQKSRLLDYARAMRKVVAELLLDSP